MNTTERMYSFIRQHGGTLFEIAAWALIIGTFVFLLHCYSLWSNRMDRHAAKQFTPKVTEFTYKEHEYIRFATDRYSSGYVHSPECKKCLAMFD